MKLAGFLLLVAVIVLSLEVQEFQAAVLPRELLGESRRKAAPFFSKDRSRRVGHQSSVFAGGEGEETRG